MWTNDELEYFTNDEGDRMVKMSIGSNMLPKITIDTYQTFTGDSWEESEIEYLRDEYGDNRAYSGGRAYEGLGWGDYDWSYNHSRELELLAEQCVNVMNDMFYADLPYEVGEVTSTYSPSYYNFATDSFTAVYTLNLDQLIIWAREHFGAGKLDDHIEDYLRGHYTSCSGFTSHVTPALDDDSRRMPTLIWGLFHAWMEFEFDRELWEINMFEGDYEIYMETRSLKLTEEGWEKFKDVVVHNRDRYLIEHDAEMLAQYEILVARAEYVPQAETLPGLEG